MRTLRSLAAVAVTTQIFAGPALAQEIGACGDLENAYGPFDYTNPMHFVEKLPQVERYHYGPGIEQLKGHPDKPDPFGRLPLDLDYTLRAFPNHHRALYTMIRYYEHKVSEGAKPMPYSAACYFDRAKRFAADDAVVVMLEGIYYQRSGKQDDALSAFERAVEMAPNSAEIRYNAGLLYLDLGRDELALENARQAYALGYPLPGLRERLRREGLWN